MVQVIEICTPYQCSNDSIITSINDALGEHESSSSPSSPPSSPIIVNEDTLIDMDRQMERYLVDSDNISDYNEWKSKGTSNSRQLSLSLMFIEPNLSFQLHAHPNIECIKVLKGIIHEIRLKASYIVKREFDIDDHDGPDLYSMCGLCNDSFEYRSTTTNNHIVNEKGSIHQSFTKEDGAILLVLWGGKHNNITNVPIELDILKK